MPPQQGGSYQQQYGAPPPGYNQQPPYSQPYGGPSPQPCYNAPAPAQYYQQQPQGQGQGYGQPPPLPQAPQYPATPASVGYGAPQIINWDGSADAVALRKAMKGFGTDEKTLIRVLAQKDGLQIAAIRDKFTAIHERDLLSDIKSETSGWFQYGLLSICRGPLLNDVFMLYDAMSGPGTKEKVLNDVLLGRSNADINAIKSAYYRTYHQLLENVVKGDLSMKTERHFMMVLSATRAEDAAPVITADIERDVNDLYTATEGQMGTDEIRVCSILTTRNDNQIRAIADVYHKRFARKLDDVIRKEFSGHMKDALLYQLRHGSDKYMLQAQLLEDAMAGVGTKDQLLISRVVRSHWDKTNMASVRGAYEQRYRKSLAQRLVFETSGDYQKLMLACIGVQV